jgi:hypothetical protein
MSLMRCERLARSNSYNRIYRRRRVRKLLSSSQTAPDQDLSAERHHEQAARHHRRAAELLHLRKNDELAAHEASVALEDSLKAMDAGIKASQYYSRRSSIQSPKETCQVVQLPLALLNQGGALVTSANCAEHHVAAAGHHDHAALEHRQASTYDDARNYLLAAAATARANSHAVKAFFHASEAAKFLAP